MTQKYSAEMSLGTGARKNRLKVDRVAPVDRKLSGAETGIGYSIDFDVRGNLIVTIELSGPDVPDRRNPDRVYFEKGELNLSFEVVSEIFVNGMETGKFGLEKAEASRLLAAIAKALAK